MNDALWGLIGVIIGSTLSGIFNWIFQRQNISALRENLSTQLKASTDDLRRELDHRKKIDKYKLMSETYKLAIDAGIDVMKSRWAWIVSPSNPSAFSQYLEAWSRSWKASGQLRLFLPESKAHEYDRLIEEIQNINFQDIQIEPSDPNAVNEYHKRMEPFREKVKKFMEPLENLLSDDGQ